MTLRLPQSYIDEMIAHARDDVPNEACGIIAGNGGHPVKLYRAINAEASPFRYSVDPKDLLRIHNDVDDNDWTFLAIYHSHTHTEAYPSPTDVRLAVGWPDAYYILVSLMDEESPVVRAYRIIDGTVTEEPLEASA
ncbi:MAG TPA: M67 family metallopeptidase [Dehalococcoidia bacterium]|jgi:proteasome lid subunit RPN8/RPN11|nr:M67 family metallopeptidase [Dehalococcoidia bacterium]